MPPGRKAVQNRMRQAPESQTTWWRRYAQGGKATWSDGSYAKHAKTTDAMNKTKAMCCCQKAAQKTQMKLNPHLKNGKRKKKNQKKY